MMTDHLKNIQIVGLVTEGFIFKTAYITQSAGLLNTCIEKHTNVSFQRELSRD